MSDLPIVQYGTHRIAYKIVAVMGLITAGLSCWGLGVEGATPVLSWIFFVIGMIVFLRCGWMAMNKSVQLELNHEGIWHKKVCYRWESLRSYTIKEDVSESGSFNYLVLHSRDGKDWVIQTDWMDNMDAMPEQMAAYAAAYHVGFEGVVRKEV